MFANESVRARARARFTREISLAPWRSFNETFFANGKSKRKTMKSDFIRSRLCDRYETVNASSDDEGDDGTCSRKKEKKKI